MSATAIYPEEVKVITAAGADEVYYYYDEVGVGFAEHVWERVFSAPEEIKPAVKDMPAI